ncbi:hypothetical protein LTR53_011298 [Teratosphaeriaceae sp. CCFEE 6253]|nr:hypothetical protein LTR53_011298 [Teratosphaeriaceae sp. CCFEE 6253]
MPTTDPRMYSAQRQTPLDPPAGENAAPRELPSPPTRTTCSGTDSRSETAFTAYARPSNGTPPREPQRLWSAVAAGTPANTGQRRQERRCWTALTNTPPRKSHMQQMSDIFSNAAVASSGSAASPAKSAHDSPRGDGATSLGVDQAGLPKRPASPPREPSRPCGDTQSAPSGSPPKPNPPAGRPRLHLYIPKPYQTPNADDSSSDGWTDDEAFLPPRSARRRHRHERLIREQLQQLVRREAPVPQTPVLDDGPLSAGFPGRPEMLRSPASSRFRRREVPAWYRAVPDIPVTTGGPHQRADSVVDVLVDGESPVDCPSAVVNDNEEAPSDHDHPHEPPSVVRRAA